MKSRWRAQARAVIARVVRENEGLQQDELRQKISDAYPFGERKYHPYKIWLSEVKGFFTDQASVRGVVPEVPRKRASDSDYVDTPLFGGGK